MLRILEVILTIIFVVGITIPIIGLFIEPLKIFPQNYHRKRMTVYTMALMFSIIAFLIIAIYCAQIDKNFVNMTFSPFKYSWNLIKSILWIYLKIALIGFMLIGIYKTIYYISTHLYKVKVNHYYSIPKCIRNMNSKEIKTYNHLHYEYFVEPIYLNDKELLLSAMAYGEFIRMMNVRKYCNG